MAFKFDIPGWPVDLYEDDAARVDRILLRAMCKMRRQEWQSALEATEGLIRRVESRGHVGPFGRDGRGGKDRYAHFDAYFEMLVFRAMHMDSDESLHLVFDDYASVYSSRAICLTHLGRPQDALDACEKAVAWAPMCMSHRMSLISCLRLVGRREDAKASILEALRYALMYRDAAGMYDELALELISDDATPDDLRLAGAIVNLFNPDVLGPPTPDAFPYMQAFLPEYICDSVSKSAKLLANAQVPLSPDERISDFAMSFASHCESKGFYFLAAQALRHTREYQCGDEDVLEREFRLMRRARLSGQWSGGADPMLSNTFIAPPNASTATRVVVQDLIQAIADAAPAQRDDAATSSAAAPAAKAGPASAPNSKPSAPNAADGLPSAHDHRSTHVGWRGNGQAPNAMYGVVGVRAPGYPLPRDAGGRGAWRNIAGGEEAQRP